jgi:hypothetical protein
MKLDRLSGMTDPLSMSKSQAIDDRAYMGQESQLIMSQRREIPMKRNTL